MEKNLLRRSASGESSAKRIWLFLVLILLGLMPMIEAQAQTLITSHNGRWDQLNTTTGTKPGWSQTGLATDPTQVNLTKAGYVDGTNGSSTRAASFASDGATIQIDFAKSPSKLFFLYNAKSGTTFNGTFLVQEATGANGAYTTIETISSVVGSSISTSQHKDITLDPNTRSVRLKLSTASAATPFYLDQLTISERPVSRPEIEVYAGNSSQTTGSTYNFATTNVKTSSSPVTFTIKNIGSAALNLLAPPTISDENPTGQFTLQDPYGISTLAPNEEATFKVVFSPTSLSGKTAKLNINSNDDDEANYAINITGSGTILPAEITSFTPTSGGVGTTVDIFGKNLINTTEVFFNGLTSKPITIVDDNRITVQAPNGATTGKISVKTVATTSSEGIFTVIPTPTITSLSPVEGEIGTLITINGTNLDNFQSLTINGQTVTEYTLVSATRITAKVPVGAPIGRGKLVVKTLGGTAEANFTVKAPVPTISSLSPAEGQEGTIVTIKGANLDNLQSISIKGQIATEYNLVNSTELMVVVPNGVTVGTGKLVVTTLGGTAEADFRVTVPSPSITSVTPSSAPVGTIITIKGANLEAVQKITFNGTVATAVTLVSSSEVKVTVPNGATSGPLVITTPGGTASTNFTVETVITSVTPNRGPIGTLVTVMVTGTNFSSDAGLLFTDQFGDYVYADEIAVNTDPSKPDVTVFTGSVPSNAVTGHIAIADEEGNIVAESATVFTLTPPAPTITSLSSTSGTPGDLVIVNGTNLLSIESVTFNGTPAADFGSIDANSFQVTVPQGATSGPLVVTTAGGTAQADFHLATTIISFTPSRGPIGTLVTVTGTNFTSEAGLLFTDQFGDYVYADEIVVNPDPTQPEGTVISGLVPSNAVSGRIAIADNDGNIVAQSTSIFTLTPPAPTITSLSSTSGNIGDLVIVNGTNLLGIESVTFNGTPAADFGSIDANSFQVTVPQGATSGPLVVTTAGGTAEAMFYVGPSITSLSPNSGLAGTEVTIKGLNLQNVRSVTIHGIQAQYSNSDINTITTVVPANARPGNGPLVVTTEGGTAQADFLVLEPTTLPVELVEFTGKRTSNGVALAWTTASERNNAYFEVQATANSTGKEFKTIQRVNSKVVNSASATSYEAEDRAFTNNAVTYYRLKQVDLDGSVEYSKTIAVENTATVAASSVKAYPNPFDDSNTLNLEVQAEKAGKLTVVMFYVTGKKAYEQVFTVESGVSTLEIPVNNSSLSSGLYILTTELNGKVSTLRVIKK